MEYFSIVFLSIFLISVSNLHFNVFSDKSFTLTVNRGVVAMKKCHDLVKSYTFTENKPISDNKKKKKQIQRNEFTLFH